MADKQKKDDAPANGGGANGDSSTALTFDGGSFKGLTASRDLVTEVIRGNFGAGHQLNFSDLDRISLPGAGGTVWQIPTTGGERNVNELAGVIVAWTDKKGWWEKSFDETGGGAPPDCRSEDMVHGIGNPTLTFNEKELTIIGGGKAQNPPAKDGTGFICATCPHNVFGSARKGGGKDCQDKRLLFVLAPESLLPFVVVAPATSIGPLKKYFGLLARDGRPYFSVITSLKLEKAQGGPNGKITYSLIVPTAVAELNGEHLEAARAYSKMLTPMVERDVMNQPALFTQQTSEQGVS